MSKFKIGDLVYPVSYYNWVTPAVYLVTGVFKKNPYGCYVVVYNNDHYQQITGTNTYGVGFSALLVNNFELI